MNWQTRKVLNPFDKLSDCHLYTTDAASVTTVRHAGEEDEQQAGPTNSHDNKIPREYRLAAAPRH